MGSGRELEDALRSLDLLVTIDLYRNATGELADYVLPATDQFEREDLNTFVQGVQGTPFVQWTGKVTEPAGEQREEWRLPGRSAHRHGTAARARSGHAHRPGSRSSTTPCSRAAA